MKKLLNLTAAIGLLAIILLVTFAACKKESSNEADISGKWMAKYPNSQLTPLYEFKSDHTFEYSLMATDSVTKKNIGVISKTAGNYQIKGEQLNLFNIVYYENKNNQYGPAADLIITTNSVKTENNKIVLDDKKNTLSVYFTCPPNANCVPSPIVYYRQ
jgi:hypothetical protein